MRVAILESIIMPGGFEVEFDRVLVEELKNQGHEPVFFVPKNYPFQLDYDCEVVHLDGEEGISYHGVSKWKRIWLSLVREKRRKEWFNSAYNLVAKGGYDEIIIPVATWRFIRSVIKTKLKDSPIPVQFIIHGANNREKADVIKYAKASLPYKNIKWKIISLREDFKQEKLSNVLEIPPPALAPQKLEPRKDLEYNSPLKIGFFGQYRKEKNVRFFLEAFQKARFTVPVIMRVQAVTSAPEDQQELDKIVTEYKDGKGIEFIEKRLIGIEWEKALNEVDVLMVLYAAERYRYHWGGLMFTALGYYKPVVQSPEINPEILQEFKVGMVADLSSVEAFSKQLENFVNTYEDSRLEYRDALAAANLKYNQEKLIQNILL